MGQINLFAPHVTPVMSEFLATYQQGSLRTIGAIRLLDEKEYPHVDLETPGALLSHVIVEVAPPLIYADIDWLYRAIIAGTHEITKETARAYSIERTLNPTYIPGKPLPRDYRRRVENEAEWDEIRKFRKCLEVPRLALEHFKTTLKEGGTVNVEKHGNVLLIEYEAMPRQRQQRRSARREPATEV